MNPLHPIYEILAKEVVYGADKPEFTGQINQVLIGAGYHPIDLANPDDTKFKLFNDSQTGFQALGLVPTDGGKVLGLSPLLIIRGIDIPLDDLSSGDSRGAGFRQFEAGKQAIGDWLKTFPTNTQPEILGHSLGGAIAQLFAAEFTDLIKGLVTFNSPGINRATANQFLQNGGASKSVTHYIVDGDVVSLAGETFLTGKAILQSFTDPAINPIYNLDKHREVGRILLTRPFNYTESELSIEELSRPGFSFSNSDYKEFLAGYAAVAPDKAALLTSRLGAETLRRSPGFSYLNLIFGARAALAPSQNNVLVGDDQNNTADGAEGNDMIVGNGGDDTLKGGIGSDAIWGNNGDDDLTGGADSDALVGGLGNDTLTGIDPGVPGLREVDAITGGGGGDRFILGNQNTAFYNDGAKNTLGWTDFALITDLKRNDTIQLHGRQEDYVLRSAPRVLSLGTSIYLKADSGRDELIGIVAGQTNQNLIKDSFTFVS